MSEEEALIAAVAADPEDNTARLVYADWLDENAGVIPCPECDGTGWEPGREGVERCNECLGVERPDDRRDRAELIRAQVLLSTVPDRVAVKSRVELRKYGPDCWTASLWEAPPVGTRIDLLKPELYRRARGSTTKLKPMYGLKVARTLEHVMDLPPEVEDTDLVLVRDELSVPDPPEPAAARKRVPELVKANPHWFPACPMCEGAGTFPTVSGIGRPVANTRCPACKGRGAVGELRRGFVESITVPEHGWVITRPETCGDEELTPWAKGLPALCPLLQEIVVLDAAPWVAEGGGGFGYWLEDPNWPEEDGEGGEVPPVLFEVMWVRAGANLRSARRIDEQRRWLIWKTGVEAREEHAAALADLVMGRNLR